jgi:5'-3' exonuclease
MQAVNMPALPASIALIDFSHMLTVHFKSQSNESGPNDAGQRTLNDLAAIRSSTDHVIVCLDSPPYWRKTVFPEYKAGREREPEYAAIYKWTVERVHADGFNVARAPGEEADDVIATLATIYTEEYGCTDVRIVGADKDALQLVTESVRCFVPKGRGEFEIRGPEHVKEKYGVAPTDFALMLAIMGDTSDKIPGIKGIGQIGAGKLINAYKNPAGMAVACTAAVSASKMDGKLPAFWRNYSAGMAELPKWLKLTTLNCNAALELHPLKYLEKLPVQKLVEEEPSDADDSGFADVRHSDSFSDDMLADVMTPEDMEEERRLMAAALPVDPAMNTNAPKTPERDRRQDAPENAARIAAGNAAEHDRFGVKRPDPSVMDHVPLEAQNAIKKLGEQLGKEGAARSQPATSLSHADSQAGASAPSSNGNGHHPAEVVPPTQGPTRAPRKLDDEITSLATTKVDAPNWALATQPGTAAEMLQISKVLLNSRFYSQYGTPQGVFAVMAIGRELGLGMAASLEAFHIVNGRPFAKAVTLRALAERHPDCEWIMITHADSESATIKTKHRRIPEVLEYSYTRERAEQAGYFSGKNRDNWVTKTQEMLEARVTSKGTRRWYPSSTMGMHAVEEANDD